MATDSTLPDDGATLDVPDAPAPPSSPTMDSASWDAALKWLAKGGAGRKPCTLSPMDEMRYFQTPVITPVRVPAHIVYPLCDTNSQRVALIIASWNVFDLLVGPSQNLAFGTPDPNNPGIDLPLSGIGIQMGQYNQILTITQKDHGPLCQSSWYGLHDDTPAITVSVVEIILRQWPPNG